MPNDILQYAVYRMDAITQVFDAGLYLSIPYAFFRIYKGCQHWAIKNQSVVCLHCGHEGVAKISSKGSALLEALLWFALILPGLLFSVWRFTTRERVCASCGQPRLVVSGTPAALAKLGSLRGIIKKQPKSET